MACRQLDCSKADFHHRNTNTLMMYFSCKPIRVLFPTLLFSVGLAMFLPLGGQARANNTTTGLESNSVARVSDQQDVVNRPDRPARENVCYEDKDLSVSVGVGGILRLGKWGPITVAVKRSQSVVRIQVETRDGQDRPVLYTCVPEVLGDKSVSQGLIRLGRYQTAVEVTVEFDNGESKTMTVPINRSRTVASTDGLVLSIEKGNRLATAVQAATQATVAVDAEARVVAKSINGVSDLPRSWMGYDAVKTIYVSTHDPSVLNGLAGEQVAALEAWVREGGRLVLSASPENSKRWLSADSLFGNFVPGKLAGTGSFSNSSRLESFVESRNQLIKIGGEPIPTVMLDDVQGKVWVGGESKQPLIIQSPLGFGDVVFIAFDLESEQVVDWGSFPGMIKRIQEIKKRTDRDRKQSIASLGGGLGQVGFSDLIGQLYAPLENFTKVSFVPFTAIAILISLYILCIGPLDYFLLRKLLGKMELTWITFPLFSLLFCGLAVGISVASRPAAMQVNQLEIVDINAITKQCRGSVWTNVYSASGRSLDVEVGGSNQLGFAVERSSVSWHGQPGSGLGGMDTSASSASAVPGYRHRVDLKRGESTLEDFPVSVASSRSLFSRWFSTLPTDVRSSLRYREGSDQVFGTVKNPLDVELINARLYHGEWAYVLDDPLGPGDAFDVGTDTNSRTLSSILNRKYRSSGDDKFRTSATRWEVSEMEISRIAEVLMFFDAAGGKSYTGLSHAYQSFIDMSDTLMLGQAVLVGEIKKQPTHLRFSEAGKTVDGLEYDQVTAFVRIVLPVGTVGRR